MNASLNALHTLLQTFQPAVADKVINELDPLIESKISFLEKVNAFDQIFSLYPRLAPVGEYAFDLLMSYHLEDKHGDENYFDTPEWLDIEDKTLERGTELLNITLYLTEARDNDVEIELEDFLNEFLLIDEDEFQDEYKIYEEIITNAELVDADPEELIKTARAISINPELKDLFVPLFLFFSQPDQPINLPSDITPVEVSLYYTLLEFYQQ
ncbi:MAG: hypothetical protein WC760_02185 [Bacteroidia bacterium]|jgi:hypothetical protein